MNYNYTINEYKAMKFYETHSEVHKAYMKARIESENHQAKINNNILYKLPIVSSIMKIKGDILKGNHITWKSFDDLIGKAYGKAVSQYEVVEGLDEDSTEYDITDAKRGQEVAFIAAKTSRTIIGNMISSQVNIESYVKGTTVGDKYGAIKSALEADRDLIFDNAITTILGDCEDTLESFDDNTGDTDLGSDQPTKGMELQ